MKESYLIEKDLKRKDFSLIAPKLLIFDDLEKKSLKIIQKYSIDRDITSYRKAFDKINTQKINLAWDVIYKKMSELDDLLNQLEDHLDENGEIKKNISHESFFHLHHTIETLDSEIEQLIEGIDFELKVDSWLTEMEYDLQINLYI